jgi:lipopolysaccharide biosynthesis glycosyltransferase
MNILLSCNDGIAKYIPALLNSIYANHEGHFINVYLMYVKENPIEASTLSEIKKFAKRSRMSKFNAIAVNAKDFAYFDSLGNAELGELFPLEACLYFLCHKYLPTHVDRVLYFDIDIIVNDNIMRFYNTDFEDKYLIPIASKAKTDGKEKREDFDLVQAKRGYYFNSGVILINVNKFREENIGVGFYKRYIEEGNLQNETKYLADQGILNYIFCDKCKYVTDMTMNFRFVPMIFPPRNSFPFDNASEIPNVKIVHYNWRPKAWDGAFFPDELLNSYVYYDYRRNRKLVYTENIKRLYQLFHKHAQNAPFYGQIEREARMKNRVLVDSIDNTRNTQKLELLVLALEKRTEQALPRGGGTENNLVIREACFNAEAWNEEAKGETARYSTKYYIKDQWLVFPLVSNLKNGSKYRFKISFATNRINKKIYCYLSNRHLQAQHIDFPSAKASTTQEIVKEFVADKDDLMALCFSSNSFWIKGRSITIHNLSIEEV